MVKIITKNISAVAVAQGVPFSHSYGTGLPSLRLYSFLGEKGNAGRIPDFFPLQYFVDRKIFQRNNLEFQNEDDIFFKTPVYSHQIKNTDTSSRRLL